MRKDYDEEVERLLKSVVDHFEQEDRSTRERQLRLYRRLKLYWNNLSTIYWSEGSRDYRVATPEDLGADDQAFYDRPMNVYRALLETIIAALSIKIPTVVCVPDDAENSMDVMTAKAGNKIAEKIYKDNEAMLLWIKTLYCWTTEGMVACYHRLHEDKKYGTYEEPKYKDKEIQAYACPGCGAKLPDDIFEPTEDAESGLVAEPMEGGEVACPECKAALDPEMEMTTLKVQEFDKYVTKNNSRIKLDIYGGLYVKIANYAMCQEETPYLGFMYETHYTYALAEYPDLKDKLKLGNASALGGTYDPYEVTARLNPQYAGEWPDNTVTMRKYWLRAKAFDVLNY